MVEHNLFRGGASTRQTSGWNMTMFPSAEVGPNASMESANHKHPVHFALSWGLYAEQKCCRDDGCRTGFEGQSAYLDGLTTPIAVGDKINAVILPRMSALIDIFYMNCCPQPGLTMELSIRGNSDSLGGTLVAPQPVVIATLDMGQITWGSRIPLPEEAGYFFNQNDMLQLEIVTVPEGGIDWTCLQMALSPVVREYLRGDVIDCFPCCAGNPPDTVAGTPADPTPVTVDPETSTLAGSDTVVAGPTATATYVATVQSTTGAPVVGADVVFSLDAGETGATFSNGETSITVATDASGQAIAEVINLDDAGEVVVTATAAGVRIPSEVTTEVTDA